MYMSFSYKKSVVGGTFDRFHLGHQKLITTAFASSEKVTIGLTKPEMYQNKLLADLIQDYEVRKERLEAYLSEKGYRERAVIMPISDIYGNTLQEKDIEAIFVTEENIPNVEKINAQRKEKEFPEIKKVIVPYVKAADGANITSERIRKGEIDSNGFIYKTLFTKQVLKLPAHLRPQLQAPIGIVVKNTGEVLPLIENKMTIAVGDIISEELRQKNIHPAISIIDFRTRRHELLHELFGKELKTINQAGTINQEAVHTIIHAWDAYFDSQEPQTIIVEGEEDLLALPAILLSPLGSIVLYGQFDQGIVVNVVTEELKKKIMQFVQAFE
jgi:pantetheine-phosphate adenylyltransferase